MQQRHKTVLITGASTGIGRACALDLDQTGVEVFAGIRSESDAASLRQVASDRLTPILIDVTIPETIAAARQLIGETVGQAGLGGLVNNAGVFYGGPLEFASLDEVRKLFEVNVFGAVQVTQGFLSLLRPAHGRIVNMSSISGRVALPFLGPYAASKFALEALSDSWRVELRPWQIHVSLIEPGTVETPILDKVEASFRKAREEYPQEAEQLYGPVFGLSERENRQGVPVDVVTRAIKHALFARKPKPRYLVSARMLSIIQKLPARLRDRLIASRFPKYG